MNDLPATNDLLRTTEEPAARLTARIDALERRVALLESRPAATAPEAVPATETPHRPAASEAPDSFSAGAIFSVLGRAMLGIAGAYVLRAAAQADLVPRAFAATIAIPYALAWLVWAARARGWFAGTAYASTSALILAPMLWELTLRFNLFSPWAAAGILTMFAGAATVLAWKRKFASVYWVANVAAVIVALGLALASHAMEPFVAVLLAMEVLAEFAAARDREPGVRTLVVLAADAAVWATIYVYVSPVSTRTDYPALGGAALIAPGFALFVVFAAGLLHSSAVRRRPITVFEIVQTMVAFLLAGCGLGCFGPSQAAVIFGFVCLTLSAAAYAATFILFDGAPPPRNYHIFAAWSLALFLTGSFLALPIGWRAAWLAAAAIAAVLLGARFDRTTLKFHGATYLLAGAAASGLAAYVARALAGSLPAAPEWNVYLVLACAVLCYGSLPPRQGESWEMQALHLLFAALATLGAAALAVRGLMTLAALGIQPGAHHLAFFRTLTACAAALGLAYGGARWRRPEFTRIGYAVLALIAVKLVAEDLRHGRLAYIAGSIFLYALTLIAVPRLARLGERA